MEFPGCEITDLAGNIIAESMYTQCDIDGNKYLLLESFIDHRKNVSALSGVDQKRPSKVNCWLGCLLQVEGWLHIIGEVIQYVEVTLNKCCQICHSPGHTQLTIH